MLLLLPYMTRGSFICLCDVCILKQNKMETKPVQEANVSLLDCLLTKYFTCLNSSFLLSWCDAMFLCIPHYCYFYVLFASCFFYKRKYIRCCCKNEGTAKRLWNCFKSCLNSQSQMLRSIFERLWASAVFIQ